MVCAQNPLSKREEHVTGTFELTGLLDAIKGEFRHAPKTLKSPLLDGGKWQMKFSLPQSHEEWLSLEFKAVPVEGEPLSTGGIRPGWYYISISTPLAVKPPTTLTFRTWTPSSSFWIKHWLQVSNIQEALFSLRDVFPICWSIRGEDMPERLQVNSEPCFARVLASMLDDEKTSDVVFVFSSIPKDDKYIFASSKILSARSQFFKTMFESNQHTNCSGIESQEFDSILFLRAVDAWRESPHTQEEYDTLYNLLNRGVFSNQPPLPKFVDDADPEDLQTEPDAMANVEKFDDDIDTGRQLRPDMKHVHVEGSSYTTYYAVLYYLYTGSYAFTSPKSTSRADIFYHETDKKVFSPQGLKDVPSASPKSVYHLCGRLKIPELRSHALEYIKESLTPNNVLSEVLSDSTSSLIQIELSSTFTFGYSLIRKVYKEYMIAHWKEIVQSPSFEEYGRKLFSSEQSQTGGLWFEVIKANAVA